MNASVVHAADDVADDRETLTRALLEQAQETTDEVEAARLRSQAVDHNYAMACGISRRYSGRGIESQDLQQVALLALVLAVRRFVPSEGRSFSAYAIPTITGELKRHFRDHGWVVRPPRGLHETYREAQTTSEELEQAGVHAPGTAAVAARMGVTVDVVRAARAVEGCFRPASLDAPARDRSGTTLADRLDLKAEDQTDEFVSSIALRQIVRALPARERMLVRLRFELDLTQREIGDHLGISQMQVSRLLTATLLGLRSTLEAQSGQRAG
ncbi:sigma-70 family RNA polymerase sigma factor [Allobranchiibius sp. CTAmp26]|uniref:sigma-70 family RNA polymerase sigma factor n=1 Tax=Allobranchiibius sp. CTAmp26 TaxID=2815214 RepID=UPI001AA17AD6|nr:sigma-70 family RNA polymerase sigma factor [Allobranchiibius sp. CTAmp26]MBO1754884.1 sigma-70 family RNA polymerase sigma factor [Allobranchiibius sp. CTAmp26]